MSSPTFRKLWSAENARSRAFLALVLLQDMLNTWGFCPAAVLVLLVGCSTSARPAHKLAPSDVVATVGTASITLEQVDEKALAQPAATFGSVKLAQALYQARRAALDEIIGNVLFDQEAKTLGVSRTVLLEREVNSHAPQVSEPDIVAWYQSNPGRVQGAPLEQVRAPIEGLLAQEGLRAARQAYLDKLMARTSVRVLLEPPRQTI